MKSVPREKFDVHVERSGGRESTEHITLVPHVDKTSSVPAIPVESRPTLAEAAKACPIAQFDWRQCAGRFLLSHGFVMQSPPVPIGQVQDYLESFGREMLSAIVQEKEHFRIACGIIKQELEASRAEPVPSPLVDALQHGMNCPGLIPTRKDECTCGLEWRIRLRTEQEMHRAWRKRAEEAELELQTLSPASRVEPVGESRWISVEQQRLPDKFGLYEVCVGEPVVGNDPHYDVYLFNPNDPRKGDSRHWGWERVLCFRPFSEPPEEFKSMRFRDNKPEQPFAELGLGESREPLILKQSQGGYSNVAPPDDAAMKQRAIGLGGDHRDYINLPSVPAEIESQPADVPVATHTPLADRDCSECGRMLKDCKCRAAEIQGGKVERYGINICDDCIALKGEMCHEARCIFCRRTMVEVGEMLDALLIRPVVDGCRFGIEYAKSCALKALPSRPAARAIAESREYCIPVTREDGQVIGFNRAEEEKCK